MRNSSQTGEDYDMLHENEMNPQATKAGSYAYKDHEDGA